MHSKRDFARIYHHCDQVSFLDAHVRAFTHFGGVPHRCVYDNLSAAVRKVLPRRQLTHRFMALASHYLFEPCFARVGVGHDKGGVEARGRGIRLQHLTPIPNAETIDAINTSLLNALDKSFNADLFEEELTLMLPLNDIPFEASEISFVSVRGNSTVQIKQAVYSVPSHWARRQIQVLVGSDSIRFILDGENVVRPRMHAKKSCIRYLDYMPVLVTKPQALRQVAPALLKELPEKYTSLWKMLVDAHGPHDAARVFCKLLDATQGNDDFAWLEPFKEFAEARQISIHQASDVDVVDIPETLSGYHVESAKASDYDVLLLENNHHEYYC